MTRSPPGSQAATSSEASPPGMVGDEVDEDDSAEEEPQGAADPPAAVGDWRSRRIVFHVGVGVDRRVDRQALFNNRRLGHRGFLVVVVVEQSTLF